MINGKFILLTLTLAGGAAAAYVFGRRTHGVQQMQRNDGMHNRASAGGNLVPAIAPPMMPAAPNHNGSQPYQKSEPSLGDSH